MGGRTLMIQGTASHVGKSLLTAALGRWFARRGWRVAPFKAQNMALNSAVTPAGEEIGRSQAFQAAACGIPPEASMNPVLLKPMGGGRCQVLLRGRPHTIAESPASPEAQAAFARRALELAAACLAELRDRFDLVLVEGMGSPAEINLRGRDAANMAVAALAEAPVLLVGDIERGGVFAALAGTLELLAPEERARVCGFVVNKYHGEPEVLRPGLAELERRYGIPCLGVLPWLERLRIEEEDAAGLRSAPRARHSLAAEDAAGPAFDIAVPALPALSNFTDLAPLESEPGVCVRYIEDASEWGAPDLVVLPGSRAVAADLVWLRRSGLAARIAAHARTGGRVVGLCGGYQMLGVELLDPAGVESSAPRAEGLGLLPVTTRLEPEKRIARARGFSLLPGLEGLPVFGYEIHHGVTRPLLPLRPALRLEERAPGPAEDGAVDPTGRIFGVYLHGLFDSAPFRDAFLRLCGAPVPAGRTAAEPEGAVFDRLAEWVDHHLAMERIVALVGGRPARERGEGGAG